MAFRLYRCRAVASLIQHRYVAETLVPICHNPKQFSHGTEQNDSANQHAANGASLVTRDRGNLLDIIDKLRFQGISGFKKLPQIVVCGDQSCGKSSILEAMSDVSFPVGDNLRTSFATELILRRSPTLGVYICIIPGADRSAEDKKRLSSFQHRTAGAALDMRRVIEDAKKAMGTSTEAKTNIFSTDVLRVEISGPTQPHLTMVGLPGLFLAGKKGQTEADATLVKTLALSYMRKARSIILAVVSARSDFAIQQVTGLARTADPQGLRTLGVITKPDTLGKGSDRERFFVGLAQNRDVRFSLGWHVLRNRAIAEHATTIAKRHEGESDFFSGGVWASLDPSQLGAAALRVRLSNILWHQLVSQLPTVLEEVEMDIMACRQILTNLGGPRRTLLEQRKYLLGASTAFSNLMRDAVYGTYTDAFFTDANASEAYTRRLRAVIQNTLSGFSKQMRQDGHAKIIEKFPNTKEPDPRYISQSAYIEEVKAVMKQSRGRELPGSYNPLIVAELFRRQCQPWRRLVRELTVRIFDSIHVSISSVLKHVVDEKTAKAVLQELIMPSIDELKRSSSAKVEELLEPHLSGHPISYNHGLVAQVQKAQNTRRREIVEEKLSSRGKHELSRARMETLLEYLGPNMEEDSCLMAIDTMRAYYESAVKKIVDDISVLAIERCIVHRLPHLFPPEVVWNLPDAEVHKIASESDASASIRERVTERLRVLEESMAELRKVRKHDASTLRI